MYSDGERLRRISCSQHRLMTTDLRARPLAWSEGLLGCIVHRVLQPQVVVGIGRILQWSFLLLARERPRNFPEQRVVPVGEVERSVCSTKVKEVWRRAAVLQERPVPVQTRLFRVCSHDLLCGSTSVPDQSECWGQALRGACREDGSGQRWFSKENLYVVQVCKQLTALLQ